MASRIRLLITKQFDSAGLRYVVGAVVGVTVEVARKWIAEGNARPYDEAAKVALAEAPAESPAATPPAS